MALVTPAIIFFPYNNLLFPFIQMIQYARLPQLSNLGHLLRRSVTAGLRWSSLVNFLSYYVVFPSILTTRFMTIRG